MAGRVLRDQDGRKLLGIRLWLCQWLIPKDIMVLGPGVWKVSEEGRVGVQSAQSIIGSRRRPFRSGHQTEWHSDG